MRLVFVFSNNGGGLQLQNRHTSVFREREWTALSTCLRKSGMLDTAPNFACLGDLTMSAFAEKLFRLYIWRATRDEQYQGHHYYTSNFKDDNSETKRILRWMLSCGYPPNSPVIMPLSDGLMTPLQTACCYGVVDLANMLIDAGADPNSTVGFCRQTSPPLCLLLSYMARKEVQDPLKLLLVERLLEIGAEVNPTPCRIWR